jgi:DNA mismatch repair protein MutS2
VSAVAESATLAALDFARVLEALAGQAQTPMGRARLAALRPSDDPRHIDELQARVAELRDFMASGAALSLGAAQPLEGALRAARVKGTVLDYDDMVAVYRTAQVSEQVRRRLARIDDLPLLAAAAARLPDLHALVAQIETVFDKDGEVRDSASPELAALRRKKRRLRAGVLESLEKMVKEDRFDSVLRDRLVTQRAGRYVVPVRAGKRGSLPGVVHDTSSSGRTIYVEPLESLEQQNDMIEVERAEQHEVQRLLADLTGHVRAVAGALATAEQVIGELDARQATARFADLTGGVRPRLVDEGLLLRRARHPLMIPELLRMSDDVDALDDEESVEPVPLDLEIDTDVRTVVVTGPNTGGKTVVLKVVGLASLLAQCGVPVPAAEARLPCRPRVHADIGDEQSIIANLSTFSAHLTRIKRFLDDSPPGALVLLDELGTGTDPAEGAALGIAVLEHLASRGVATIATTHHDALKAYAHGAEAAVNAAMEFNSETLQPTFRLRMGLPGRSNAFDIAARLGLDESLVGRARDLLGGDTAQLDSLIRSVEGEAEALATDREGVQQEQDRLADAHRRYEALNRRLVDLRDELAGEGREAVDDALATVRRAGEELLEELARELGETRKSRAAQDRRAAWAAKVGAAEAEARRQIDGRVRAATKAHDELVRAARDVPESPVADEPEEEMVAADDPDSALERGEPVLVMPLRLRGKVARDWPGGDDADSEVEVDVQGKRLIVERRQVHRRNR